MGKIDDAGRAIAGLLTYNPGPGIYSRLERAVQDLPDSVRAQELPGLLKRYKEGIPGWELKATDLDSVIDGRDVVPKEELLARVRSHSPVYTHMEAVQGGSPQTREFLGEKTQDYFESPQPLGRGGNVAFGPAQYEQWGQGGKDYSELLLLQPSTPPTEFGSHWRNPNVVAHARYDTHGDALRINELQSDLGIHNRKAREYADQNPQVHFGERLNPSELAGLPFPMEDNWSDLLVKRLALEAAQKGHRAIEVASPRAIADKVGGNIENYEHFYGKVVPGALERLGRKMGGLTPESTAKVPSRPYDVWQESEDLLGEYRRLNQGDPEIIDAFNDILDAPTPGTQKDAARRLYEVFYDGDPGYATAKVREALALADRTRAARGVRARLDVLGVKPPKATPQAPGRRYIMSDEMRRRLIEGGVGAAVGAGMMSQDDLIERLSQ
jgi:hypothetical protein